MDMKLKSTSEIYRNPNIDQNNKNITHKKVVMTNMGETLNAIQKGQLNVDGDTLELSDEAKGALQEAFDQAMAENAKINEMNAAKHDAVAAEQASDAMEEAFKDDAKALEIARRIGKGGIVPAKDEAFLMEKMPDMYKLAKMQGMMAEEQKRHKTVLGEKEQKEYDWDKGQDDTKHRVALDIAIDGENVEIEGISEVSISGADMGAAIDVT